MAAVPSSSPTSSPSTVKDTTVSSPAVVETKDSSELPQVIVHEHLLKATQQSLLNGGDPRGYVRAHQTVDLDESTVFHVHINAPLFPVYGTARDAFVITATGTAIGSAPSVTATAQLKAAASIDSTLILAIVVSSDVKAHAATAWSGTINSTTVAWYPCRLVYIPDQTELFSRAKGILETGVLKDRTVGIIGLGSGGSPVALELARSGVGRFVLIDYDIIELSNVARHVCDVRDLGRKKTRAVADKVRAINPYAHIECYDYNICEKRAATEAALMLCDVLIAGTDNNESRFILNEISLKFQKPAIFGRVIVRGAGGDVVRVRPGTGGPCLACIFTREFLSSSNEQVTSVKQARAAAPAYVPDDEVVRTVQVGLSCDIAPITNMIVKLAIVELSRGIVGSGVQSLEVDLEASFYMWANRREENFAKFKPLRYEFSGPPLSILRWYGLQIKGERCDTCTPKAVPSDVAAANQANEDLF